MPVQRVLSPELTQLYQTLRDVLQRCLDMVEKCSEKDHAKTLRGRLDNLHSAALFVIVGEVKAGKSSFVNALLRENVCEVAPDPCTARIQELVYGEKKGKTELGPNCDRVKLNKEVLKEISIVDTPGTNSIILDHQTITEKYVPESDLVVFVFPAKNPHTATAWQLLTNIRKEWQKKMVFVLQQADLVTTDELKTNISSVMKYARERNVQEPKVFNLSAKRELEGAADSGFAEFRQYLSDAVEKGDVWQIKKEGVLGVVKKVLKDLLTKLSDEETSIDADRKAFQDQCARLKSRKAKADSLKRSLVDSV